MKPQLNSVEKRLDALEEAAKRLERQRVNSNRPALSFEDIRKRMDAILERERPARTPQEQVADFTAALKRMQANDALRHERY